MEVGLDKRATVGHQAIHRDTRRIATAGGENTRGEFIVGGVGRIENGVQVPRSVGAPSAATAAPSEPEEIPPMSPPTIAAPSLRLVRPPRDLRRRQGRKASVDPSKSLD